MSEHITHIAVYEDTARLIAADSENFPAAFPYSIKNAYDSGLFCSGSRGNHLFAVPILEKYKGQKPEQLGEKAQEQIAGALGWLSHRASDLQMKPLFRILEDKNHPVFEDNECQMYHDAITFKEVYKGGTVSTGSKYEKLSPATLSHQMKGTPAAEHINVTPTENIITHYFMSEFARLQNLKDEEDINQFADNIIQNSQNLYEDLRIYINAFQDPEYHKLTAYIYNDNMYDEEDSIIKIVRDMQLFDEYPDSNTLKEALQTSEDQSQYAQALKKGYDFLHAAGRFYNNNMDKSDLYDFYGIYTESHRI